VTQPRLLKFFRKLPKSHVLVDSDQWEAGQARGILRFRRNVLRWYNEGTLSRLLDHGDPEVRRAAVFALSLVGNMTVNSALAAKLVDDDEDVRKFASDALWSVWFRGGDDEQIRKLQEAVSQRDLRQALRRIEDLIRESADYAEAYNQRAVVYYRMGEFNKAIADCEQVLKLNPHHFGAAAGMGQCYVRLKKPRAALRAFKSAYRINPNLDYVKEAIQSLEDVLGDR